MQMHISKTKQHSKIMSQNANFDIKAFHGKRCREPELFLNPRRVDCRFEEQLDNLFPTRSKGSKEGSCGPQVKAHELTEYGCVIPAVPATIFAPGFQC
jgi:hypothetical protein